MDEPSRGILNHPISSTTAVAPNTLSPTTSSASTSGPLSPTATQPPNTGIIRTESGTGSSGPEAPPTGITIQIKEPLEQRGRSRNKHSSSSAYGTSRSRTKSRSLSRLQIADPHFLKWTILNHDPSERLRQSNRLEVVEDDISDEEHISDVDNDYDLDAELDYDLGARVLPNFVVSIQKVLDAQNAWLAAYLRGPPKPPAPDVRTLEGPCKRALLHMSRHRSVKTSREQQESRDRTAGSTFVLYLEDLNTSCAEKLYALTYTFGAILSQGDTLYVLVQCDVDDVELHIARVRDQVAYLLDCTNGVLDSLDVVLLALHHPYPRHLLTETLEAFQPAGLVVPLQIATGSLAGYVSFVPTLVVRKKLRRARRRGICD